MCSPRRRGLHTSASSSRTSSTCSRCCSGRALLALVGGLPELSVAIVLVILVNAVFAFVQEYRAERAVEALRQMLPLDVRVRRDGEAIEIASEQVVPGDVLLLAPGDRVAADADCSSRRDLRVDESTLTGEAYPGRAREHVFAGTFVTAGSGEALVTATGMATRFGRIADLAQRTRRERSPLERELDRVTRFVAAALDRHRRRSSSSSPGCSGWASPTGSCSRSASWSRSSRKACCRP